MRRLFIMIASVPLVLTASTPLWYDRAGAESAFNRDASAYTPDSIRTFDDFPLYDLGDQIDGLPLTAILRRDSVTDSPAVGRVVRDYVSFVYGDCLATDHRGCASPVEVQVWPSCVRSPADYTLTPKGDPLPARWTTIRGIPAAFYEDNGRLELYTGGVTIVMWGLGPEQLRRAAGMLRRVNGAAGDGRDGDLPPPAQGALEGTATCTAS